MALRTSSLVSDAKLYKIRGAQYCNKSRTTTFRFYAPKAKNVWVILTLFGREEHKLNMERTHTGPWRSYEDRLWEVVTHLAQPGRTYLYLVNNSYGNKALCKDPMSFSVLYIQEVSEFQSVVPDQTSYQWNDQDWMKLRAQNEPLRSPLSIYEIQLKAYQNRNHQPLNFRELAPELIGYCRQMGFTHIQLRGFLEYIFSTCEMFNFFGTYYGNGKCDDLKYFVDYSHQNGIGLIIDWIQINFEGFYDGTSCQKMLVPSDEGHVYAIYPSSWGTKLFFDFNKEETCRLFSASALYYLDELHVDGIRFDAVRPSFRPRYDPTHKKIIFFDHSHEVITFLRQLNEIIHTRYPGVLTISETTKEHLNLTKSIGFDLTWDIVWSYNTMNLLRTPYVERSLHWKDKVLDMLHCTDGNADRMIRTLSHTDRDSSKNKGNHVLVECVAHAQSDMERFSDLRNFFAWQILAPNHSYMIQMGDEVVEPKSWYERSLRKLFNRDWSASNGASLHDGISECIRDLNNLYRHNPQFWRKQDFMMIYEYGPNLVVAYHRGIYLNRRIVVIHNFSNREYKSYDVPLPTWDPNVARIEHAVEIFNTDHFKYGGSGSFQNQTVEIVHHDGGAKLLRLAIPPLATLVLQEHLL